MELLHYRAPHGNFGDDLNEWLWDRLLPGWQTWDDETVLIGLGTLLQQRLIPQDHRRLVVGTGTGYGTIPDLTDDPGLWDIRAVRGPLTARALGLPPDTGIIDPAALLSDLHEFAEFESHGETLFVPHHHSATTADWEMICAGSGITALSPTGDARTIIRRIAGARRVIAESMHAAIVADAFRVPWQAVQLTGRFNHFKWRDWGYSVEMDLTIHPLVPASTRRHMWQRLQRQRTKASAEDLMAVALQTLTEIADGRYHLSDEHVLSRRRAALWRVLDDVGQSYSA